MLKKKDKAIPIAASLLILECRVVKSMKSIEIHPAANAPARIMRGFLFSEIIKARQTPGSTACATASPTNALFFNKAKQPTMLELIVNNKDPSSTFLTFGSAREKKAMNLSIMFCLKM